MKTSSRDRGQADRYRCGEATFALTLSNGETRRVRPFGLRGHCGTCCLVRCVQFAFGTNAGSGRMTIRVPEQTQEASVGGHLNAIEIKAFVPARDFALSRRFYEDLGFTTAWSDSDLAYLRCGDCSFLLQNFYHFDHAGNFMIHMLVADLEAWWRLSAGHEIRGARRTAGGPALGHARLHDYRPDRGTLADRTKLRLRIRQLGAHR